MTTEDVPQFCATCGKQAAATDDTFCRGCGARLEPSAAVEPEVTSDAATPEQIRCWKCGTIRVGATSRCPNCREKWPVAGLAAVRSAEIPLTPRGSDWGWLKWAFLGLAVLVIGFAILAGIGALVGEDESSAGAVLATDTRAAQADAPTLTADQAQYVASVATANAEATRLAREADLSTRNAAPTRTPIPTKTPIPPPYKLALISANCTRTSDTFTTCEGFVQNISGETLENVEVVIEWADAAGLPQSSDEALIDYNPILPGQQSPWSTIGTYNPALTQYRVTFKELLGGTLLTRDDRQQ